LVWVAVGLLLAGIAASEPRDGFTP
jgi:hypothetical protein